MLCAKIRGSMRKGFQMAFMTDSDGNFIYPRKQTSDTLELKKRVLKLESNVRQLQMAVTKLLFYEEKEN